VVCGSNLIEILATRIACSDKASHAFREDLERQGRRPDCRLCTNTELSLPCHVLVHVCFMVVSPIFYQVFVCCPLFWVLFRGEIVGVKKRLGGVCRAFLRGESFEGGEGVVVLGREHRAGSIPSCVARGEEVDMGVSLDGYVYGERGGSGWQIYWRSM